MQCRASTAVSTLPDVPVQGSSDGPTTRSKSSAFLRKCAKENPALVLRADCRAPTIHPSTIKALVRSVDFDKVDPLYLIRLAKHIDGSIKDKIIPRIASLSRSIQKRALRVCWDNPDECPAYISALEDYVHDTLFSYSAIKSWFERKVFRVLEWTGKGLVLVKNDASIKQNSEHDIVSTYKEICYHAEEGEEKDPDQSGPTAKKRFITKWLNDPLKKTYSRVDCNPSRTQQTPPDVYNIWSGIKAEKLPPVPEQEVNSLIEPIVDHIRIVITDKNEEHLRFFLAWLAQMIKFPEKPTCVALLLQGEHGVGKNAPLDFFRDYVLGKEIAFRTGNPEDVFEKHSICRIGKLIIEIDEANGQVTELPQTADILEPSLTR